MTPEIGRGGDALEVPPAERLGREGRGRSGGEGGAATPQPMGRCGGWVAGQGVKRAGRQVRALGGTGRVFPPRPALRYSTTAALTALATRPNRLPDATIWLVSTTQTNCCSGSAQAAVPVAPMWPKVEGEHSSPK